MIEGTGSWEYFEPEGGNGIVGMEKMLDDGSALDVLGYGVNGEVSEYSWMVRLWDGATQSYRNIASYDSGTYYDDLEQAYDGLIEHVQANFSHLLSPNDEMVREPEKAKTGFLRKAMLCGLAAMISFSMIGMVGCSSEADASGDEGSVTQNQRFGAVADTHQGTDYLSYINDGVHDELAYDRETLIVYYVFRDGGGKYSTGYMSPYIGANGHYCRWIDGQIVELSD